MPLTWDVSAIKNHKVVTTNPDKPDHWHPITYALVMMSMRVGWGWELTEQNAPETYARIKALEALEGPFLFGTAEDGTKQDILFTWDHVRSHIGLKTNTSPITKAKFWALLRKVHEEKCTRQIQRAEEADA